MKIMKSKENYILYVRKINGNESDFVNTQSMLSLCGGKEQVLLLFLIQLIIMVLMGTLTTYGPEARANVISNHSSEYCA